MIELHITEEGVERTDYDKRGNVRFKVQYPHIGNIPEPVRTKLSVLRLMQPPQEIEQVGQKVSEVIYWIYDDGFGGYENFDSFTREGARFIFALALSFKQCIWQIVETYIKPTIKGIKK